VRPAFEIRFSGTLEGFEEAFDRLRLALDAEPLDAGPRYQVELVFEEIVANIVRHGAVGGRTPDVRVRLELDADSIRLSFDDDGVSFDPRVRPERAPPKAREGAGGFGLLLVHRAASSLDYLRTAEGHNRLTVTLPRTAIGETARG
jgi:anti-sigma regulatory factor (Ser/Thr protein kinase)